MACRANKDPTTTTITSQSCKSSGGGVGVFGFGSANSGAVIARGAPSPQQHHNQNNNKFASTRVQQDHLPNFGSGDTSTDTTATAKFASEILDEMAGDIRLVDGKKPRKLWTLRDRSTMSVHLLKANLAEDGCEEAQLDVAKKLLQDSMDPTYLESVQKENCRLAIYWLIKSSEQGNEEATLHLQECLSTGCGITGQNVLDVKTCISTPTNEKLTFKAARLLYLKLNNGEEFITTTQLEARIHEVRKKVQFQEPSPSSQESPHDSYNENEDSTISGSGLGSMSNSVDGDSEEKIDLNTTFTYSSQNPFDVKPDEGPTHLDDDMCTKQSLSFEQLSNHGGVKLTIHDLLNAAGLFNSGNLPRPTISSKKKEFDRHNWRISCQLNAFVAQLLILAALSGTIKLTHCCIYSTAWASIWASYNVLVWKKRYSNFRDWSEAFKSVLVQGTWTDETPESRLLVKFLLPYMFCLAGSLVLISILNGLTLIKVIMGVLVMFSVFRGAMRSQFPSWRIMLIFEIASLPNILWYLSIILDTFLDLGISLQAMELKLGLIKQLEIYFIIPSRETMILTLQIMLILSLLWRRKNSLLRESLPELLFAFWFLEISKISVQLNKEEMYICCSVCTVLVLSFLIFESNVETWKAAIIVTIVILFGVSGLCASVKPYSLKRALTDGESSPSTDPFIYDNIDSFNHIEWNEYNTNCHKKAWKVMSPAETQLKCYLRYGGSMPTAVRWLGRLSLVKVRDIKRNKDDVIEDASFDLNINILVAEGSEDSSWQSYLPGSDSKHSAPASILVSTKLLSNSKEKQNLIDHVLNLRMGDRFEFHGILDKDSVGSLKPEIINVQSMKCLNCAVAENYAEFFLKPNVNVNEKQESFSSTEYPTALINGEHYFGFFKVYWKLLKSYF